MKNEADKLASALRVVHEEQQQSPPTKNERFVDDVMDDVMKTNVAAPGPKLERMIWSSVAAAAAIVIGCVLYVVATGSGVDTQLADLWLVDPSGLYGTPY